MLLAKKEFAVDDQQLVKMFIEGMGAGVWVWDLLTGQCWWSNEMYALLGYTRGETSIDQHSFLQNILHPADAGVLHLGVGKQKTSDRLEIQLKHKNEGYQWFKLGYKIQVNDLDEPVTLYGSVINIHARKMAEERIAIVVEGVEAGVWEWDIEAGVVWWSDKLYDQLGYQREEVIDNRTFLRSCIHPDDLEKMDFALQKYLVEQKTYKVELRMRHRSGEYLWFESSGKCRLNDEGKPVKMVGSLVDCHSRKTLEEQASYNEFLLNEAGKMGRIGGWELDLKGNRLYWSKATYEIHEATYDYVPDKENSLGFFHPESHEKINTVVARAIKFGESYELESRFITAKKRTIWVKLCCQPVFNEENEVVKLRGVLMDIDKEKHNDIDLKKSLDLLAKQNEQLSGFSHILSHNLRNHAGNIALIARLLNERIDLAERENLTENLYKVSQRLNATLDEMGRALQQGDTSVSREVISFSDLLSEIKEVLSNTILSLHIQIASRFEVSHITYPRMYLESILMNLISNAIKYRKPATSPNIYISTYVDADTGRIVLECTDNGMGIDLDKHGNKLFSLYKTFHANQDAHGVGLFLIRTQIESQGGQISVQSKPGVGASFKVLF